MFCVYRFWTVFVLQNWPFDSCSCFFVKSVDWSFRHAQKQHNQGLLAILLFQSVYSVLSITWHTSLTKSGCIIMKEWCTEILNCTSQSSGGTMSLFADVLYAFAKEQRHCLLPINAVSLLFLFSSQMLLWSCLQSNHNGAEAFSSHH